MAKHKSESRSFEPRVAGFFCHECCSRGDERTRPDAGDMSPNLASIKFACASTVDSRDIGEVLDDSIDGVLICGCMVGSCLNCSDDGKVLESIHGTTVALHDLGLAPGRLRREWVCIPGGESYDKALDEFVDHLRELGPRVPDRKAQMASRA